MINFIMDMIMILLGILVVVSGFALLDLALLDFHFTNKLRHKLGIGDLEL
jgi:hypothetical protein